MGEAAWGAAASAAVGIGTAVMANSQASEQEDYMQSLVNQGQGNRDLIEGIDRYFLGGGRAADYDIPGFADQFGQLDFMREEQEQLIDNEVRDSQQLIEDTMPSGGSKLRALAELSIKSQDAKNTINREYEGKKNDLDVNLTNQYLQGAMGRQGGVGYDTQYAYGMQGLQNSQNMMAGIGTSLGRLAGSLGKDKKGMEVEVIPKSGYDITPTGAGSTIQEGNDYWDFADDNYADWRIE
jgi:hypothetical protein